MTTLRIQSTAQIIGVSLLKEARYPQGKITQPEAAFGDGLEEPTDTAGVNPAQAVQALMQSAQRFGQQFNAKIRAYNKNITQVRQSIALLQKMDWNNSVVDPNTIIQQTSALQQTLDNATAEQSQDAAFLQQLSTQAAQLTQSVGGAGQTPEQAFGSQPMNSTGTDPVAKQDPNAAGVNQGTAQPGWANQVGQGIGTAVKAPGRWMGKAVDWAKQQGRQFGQGYSAAESGQIILTAFMGCPSNMFLK